MKHAKPRNKILIAVVVVLIVVTIGFIFSNSMQDIDDSNMKSGFIGTLFGPVLHIIHDGAVALFGWTQMSEIVVYDNFIRKMAHFLEFATLGAECSFLVVLLDRRPTTSLIWMALFVPLAAAVVDEFIQSFHERTSAVADVLLDFSGACCGILFVVLCWAVWRAISRK